MQTVTIRSQVSRPFENDLALLCEALKAPAVFDDLNAELCLKLLNGDGKGRLRNFLEIMGPASQHALVYPRTRRRSHNGLDVSGSNRGAYRAARGAALRCKLL